MPFFQNYLVGKITKKLSKELNTTVSIGRVNLELFDRMQLRKTLILDQSNDTLLYAGALSVNITDWFFFKKNIDLKYIGITDAVIYAQRDSVPWNYQFIVDYFSSGGNSGKKSKPINLDLKVIQLRNVSLNQNDHWIGTDKFIYTGLLRLDAEQMDFNKRILNIRQINLEKPIFSQTEYDGLRPPRDKKAPSEPDTTADNLPWNADNWKIIARKINIKNGQITIIQSDSSVTTPGLFNGSNIRFSDIDAVLKNSKLDHDTLTADIDEISAKERSGFTVRRLNSKFRMTPEGMEFTSLKIETGKSILENSFAMRYQSFGKDMNDFIHRVHMEGKFENTTISSDDLAFFAPETKKWNLVLSVNGNISGKVDNLTAQNLLIKDNASSTVQADVSLRGLPNIDEAFMDLRIRKLNTNINSLARIIPVIKTVAQPDLSSLGNLGFAGSFTGYFNDFVIFGNLNTSLGNFNTDLQLRMPEKKPPVFSGKLATGKFDLGKFIGSPQMGNIAFNGALEGKGLTLRTIDFNMNGNIQELDFSNYPYKNIAFNGRLTGQEFSGNVNIDDPNLQVENLAGTFNFGTKSPFFNFKADVHGIYFGNLGIMNRNLFLSGILSADFKGKNIDDFLGSARIMDARLIDEDKNFSFDSLTITSVENDGAKTLSLQTNELEASLNGNFKILQLPAAFRLFLSQYYPAYIETPEGNVDNQDFTFSVQTKRISDFINLFDKKLSDFNDATIEGSVNTANNHLELNADIPRAKFTNMEFENIELKSQGNKDTLGLNMTIGSIITKDSSRFPMTIIDAVASNDLTNVHIYTVSTNNDYALDLSAFLRTRKAGFTLSFNPSEFFVDGKKWTVRNGGEINLDKQIININKFQLFQEEQAISISTRPSRFSAGNDIYVDMNSINIGSATAFFFTNPHLDGALNAEVQIINPIPFDSSTIHFNTVTKNFTFENDTIGTLKANGTYDFRMKSLYASVEGDDDPYRFNGNILYQMEDSLSPVSGTVNFDRTEIDFLNVFLSGIAHDIRGRATGVLNISGQVKDPLITGTINLNEGSLIIDYTQCQYKIADNSKIKFNPDEISFDQVGIRDKNNRSGTFNGIIRHRFFDNFSFNNLTIGTENNFQLLNTTLKDNNQFYGNVTGRAQLSINGPASDIQIDIKGAPTDSSHIFIPISESAESGGLDYIDFIQFGREMEVSNTTKIHANISVNMEITATPFATVDVILDETTGDVIKAQGSGKLFITAGTHDPLTIRGRYNIEGGQYTFNFQTFLQTPFTLQQGFIEWQGDPYEALLNVDAVYHAQNVNLNNIPSSSGFSNTQGDIDVIFLLRGTLKNPDPHFEFQFPFNNPLKSDPIAAEYLRTRFQSSSSEMLNQVASLLLFNTFLTTDQGTPAANATTNFVGKTVGQLLSATLTSSLNTWLQRVLKTNTINLYTNINATDLTFQQNLNELPVQNLGKVGVRYAFHKNKYIFYLGSNLNYRANPGLANNNSDLFVTPDFSFEMLISPNGNLRVVGFNRSDLDPVNVAGIASRNRTGVQLSYRKDFENFEEFFTGRRRKRGIDSAKKD